jgi:hypothetical protein
VLVQKEALGILEIHCNPLSQKPHHVPSSGIVKFSLAHVLLLIKALRKPEDLFFSFLFVYPQHWFQVVKKAK